MLTQTKKIIRDLGDGLILRHASPEDADALSQFNGEIHAEDEADKQRIIAWTRDLLTRPHSTLKPEDFTIIEESATKRIVSSLNLIPQIWSYEGIEFGVGRPELVGTLPEYRGRGLTRIQFDEIHQWSANRGLMVQAITGIPYFYRQFGYEFALELAGRRYGFQIPKLKEGHSETFHFHPAEEKDIPFIMSVYDHGCKRSMISAKWTQSHWHNNLYEQSEQNSNRLLFRVIESTNGESVGYLAHEWYLRGASINMFHYELKPGVSWLEVTPSVARYLWNVGQEYAKNENSACTMFGFVLGTQHPSYEVMGESLPRVHEPYAWYLRVPDLIGFLQHIKPALEERLAESIACGHSGELLICMYPKGIRLILENGRIALIEPWKPDHADHGNAGFPALTFLQVLFGYRSYEELKDAFADCWWDNGATRLLINTLFPKKHSKVYGIA